MNTSESAESATPTPPYPATYVGGSGPGGSSEPAVVSDEPPSLDPHVDPDLTEVHVLGFTSSKRDAPWDRWQEPGVEIWGLNNLHVATDVPTERCHRWFDMHPADVITSDLAHLDWLRANAPIRPCYTFHRAVQELTASFGIEGMVEFPVDRVIDLMSTRYFTNSISWMIGYAAHRMQPALERAKRYNRIITVGNDLGLPETDVEGMLEAAGFDTTAGPPPVPMIGVHGVDMATDTEYGAQRPSCEYLLGIVGGAGFRITIARASDLLSSGELYGVDDNGKLRAKMLSRRAEMQEQLTAAVAARNAAQQEQIRRDGEINHLNGAIADVTYWQDRWTMPEINRETASKPGQIDGQ